MSNNRGKFKYNYVYTENGVRYNINYINDDKPYRSLKYVFDFLPYRRKFHNSEYTDRYMMCLYFLTYHHSVSKKLPKSYFSKKVGRFCYQFSEFLYVKQARRNL